MSEQSEKDPLVPKQAQRPLQDEQTPSWNVSTTNGSVQVVEEDLRCRSDAAIGHRPNGTSNFSTIMHIIKGNLGTGILAIPNAFTNSGILVGTLGLVFLGIICVHCMHLLVKSAHVLCRKTNQTSLDYACVAEQSFKLGSNRLKRYSKVAKTTVNVFLMITQFGFCCVYILFLAKNFEKVLSNCIPGFDTTSPRIQVYEVGIVALLIPFVMIRDIKYLAPFSMVANFASFAGLFIIGYVVLRPPTMDLNTLPLAAPLASLPLYFGTAIYAFEGIGVVLPMENEMKEPSAFARTFGVLDMGMVIVCALYIFTGFYGYLKFGADCSGSITLNMPGWEGTCVEVIFILCIFVSYAVQFYVPMKILEPKIRESRLSERFGFTLVDCTIRALLVLLTFGLAAAVNDYLDLLISLIGAVASSTLALIFPPLLDIITSWPDRHDKKGFWCIVFKDVLIMILGIIGFVTGTAVSLMALVKAFSAIDASGISG